MMNTYNIEIFTSQRTDHVSKGSASMADKVIEFGR